MREKEYLKYLDKLENERLRMKINTDKGKIVDMVIHGHTHSPTRILSLGDIPLINVNVEAWGYTPVSIDTILELYKSVK